MTRLIDHLCPQHTEAALTRWPIAGTFAGLLHQCRPCGEITARLHPSGTYSIRCLPDLDHRTYEHSDAIHEAAHAVLGLEARMPLKYAVIEPRTDEIQVGGRSHVKWDDYAVPLDQWAAMAWAGQRAQHRWFTFRSLDCRANLVDIAGQGVHDTQMVLEAAAEHGVPENIGWDLCADLLDDRWAAVERVADMLLARGRLSGDEIAELAGFAGCNR